MVYEIETGDVFQAAYLVSRGGRVVKAAVQGGGGHVVLTVKGEDITRKSAFSRTTTSARFTFQRIPFAMQRFTAINYT